MIGDGDVAAIMGNGDFDTPAVFTLAAGGTVTVDGWFTGATEQTNLLTNEIETVNAAFDTEATGIATVKRGDGVVINSVTYKVGRIQQIGTEVATVFLKS